ATSPAITIDSVTKRFGQIFAVEDLSLTIHPGEVLALLGPNGAGKTTLLDMVLGFAEPTQGSIRTFGISSKAAASNGMIGAVLQEGGLLDELAVGDTSRMIASCHHWHLPVDEVIQRAGVQGFTARK